MVMDGRAQAERRRQGLGRTAMVKHLVCARPCPLLNRFIFTANPEDGKYYYSHFTDEETKSCREAVTCHSPSACKLHVRSDSQLSRLTSHPLHGLALRQLQRKTPPHSPVPSSGPCSAHEPGGSAAALWPRRSGVTDRGWEGPRLPPAPLASCSLDSRSREQLWGVLWCCCNLLFLL